MVGEGRSRAAAYLAASFVVSASALSGVSSASAQTTTNTIFCPPNVPVSTGAGFVAQNGICTNGLTGAFSGAALGSQSLSDLAQGSTQATTAAASGLVQERRQQELLRCPAGTTRVGGSCQPIRAQRDERPAPRAASRAERQQSARAARAERQQMERTYRAERAAARRAGRPMPPPPVMPTPGPARGVVSKDGPVAAPILPYFAAEPDYRVGTFARGFGDYEERSGRSQAGFAPTPPINAYGIDSRSRTTLTGAVGGLDLTRRGLLTPDDGVIFGVLGGYSSNDITFINRTISTVPAVVGNGTSRVRANAEGGSAGAFLTYFQGPVSLDLLYKADFLNLTERFVDNQAYTATPGAGPTVATVTGRGSTELTAQTIAGNFNYRIPLGGTFFMEPTAGVQARWTDYARSAAALGLADGHTVRLQAGSRFGYDYFYNGVTITPILTGLAYSDVSVRGGFLDFSPTGNFPATATPIPLGGAVTSATSVLTIRQEGLLRGQGILTIAANFNNGWTAFIEGNVRGGKDLFGAGGQAGIRYQW